MSPLEQLVTERLGEPLRRWLNRQRREGVSYRDISEILRTEYHVDVSKSTVHLWCANLVTPVK